MSSDTNTNKLMAVLLCGFLYIQGMAQSNQAVTLNGVNEHLGSPVDIYTNTDVQDGTMGIWFKTGASFSNITQIASYEGFISLSMNPSGTLGACSDGVCTSANSTATYNDGKWHFAVITWDSNIETNLYIDGVFIANATPQNAPNPDATSGRALILGYHPAFPTTGFDYFNGALDEVSIWSRKFSVGEVNWLMDSCLTGSETDLLGHWKLESMPATTDPDQTSAGNNLTLTGGTWTSPGAPVCCNLDLSVSQNGTTLSANATGVAYQWVDCDNAYTSIVGATNQTFVATQNGRYAVVITSGSCVDTSNCYTISGVGLHEKDLSHVTIYPNPVENRLRITGLPSQTSITYKIISISGTTVRQGGGMSGNLSWIEMKDLADGLYFIEINTDWNKIAKRVIKK